VNKKLSIITINLNNAVGLKKTIESVVNQSYYQFEYIIIDGASIDDSVGVINMFKDKIDYWVSEKDNGIYHAMNKGILKACGEYCIFLNSGDLLVDNILDNVFSLDFNEDIIYGNAIFEDKDGPININQGCGKSSLSFYDFYSDTIRHQSAFIKRRLFDEYGLYDESFSIVSDWYFFIKAIIFGDATCQYRNINISHFDIGGIGTNFTQQHKEERETVFRKLLPEKVIIDYENFHIMKQQFEMLSKETARYRHRFLLADKLLSAIKFLINVAKDGIPFK
jgi:glycosyltransferase involved in cell wall biosynthesis